MLIYKPKKLMVLRLRDPERVTTVIPKSKTLWHDGKQYIAVNHGVEEVKVLANLGIKAPSPIEHYYDWPGRFAPYAHQKQTAAFATLNTRCYIINGMGSGKTNASLWAYDYLRQAGVVKKALIIAPLSTLDRTWGDAIFEGMPHLNFSVLFGDRKKRLQLLDTDADIYIINHDGIKVNGFVEAMAEREDIDLIIIDELAQIARNAGTDRFKALQTIVNRQCQRRAWGMTGTPTPNGPMDAWAQCRLMTPEKVPSSSRRFRDTVMRQINQFLWVPRMNAMDTVYESMQPSIRFSLEECVDLPPCIYETREIALTPPQEKAYKDMLTKLKAEAEAGEILAVNEAVKAQKLIQIALGVAYGVNGEEVEFDATPRFELIKDIVEESGQKAIIFAPFVATVKALKAYLIDNHITTESITGETSKAQRDDILFRFQKTVAPRVLVASPGTMSHGLTLTAASTIIWAGPITSNDIFEQANARITRPGQKHTQLIVTIEATEIERKYYKRLKDKQKTQGVLLDMVQEARVKA